MKKERKGRKSDEGGKKRSFGGTKSPKVEIEIRDKGRAKKRRKDYDEESNEDEEEGNFLGCIRIPYATYTLGRCCKHFPLRSALYKGVFFDILIPIIYLFTFIFSNEEGTAILIHYYGMIAMFILTLFPSIWLLVNICKSDIDSDRIVKLGCIFYYWRLSCIIIMILLAIVCIIIEQSGAIIGRAIITLLLFGLIYLHQAYILFSYYNRMDLGQAELVNYGVFPIPSLLLIF